MRLLTTEDAARESARMFPGTGWTTFLGEGGAGPATDSALDGMDGESTDPELEQIMRLASSPSRLLRVTSALPGADEAVSDLFVIDAETAMAVHPVAEGWMVSDPIALEDLIWQLVAAVGSAGVDEGGRRLLASAAEVADPSDSRELSELLSGARLMVSGCELPPDGLDPSAYVAAAGFGETLMFAGHPGLMHHVVTDSNGGCCFTRLTEEELVSYLELVTGPPIEPPELPITELTSATADALTAKQPTTTAEPQGSGRVNNLGIASCEARCEEGRAAPWQLALMRPEAIATMERRRVGEESSIVHRVSVGGGAAVLWSHAYGATDWQWFDDSEAMDQVAQWLALVCAGCPSPDGEPRNHSITEEQLAGPVGSWMPQEWKTSVDYSSESAWRGYVSLLVRSKDGMIRGAEHDFIALPGVGLFLIQSETDRTFTINDADADAMVSVMVDAIR